MQHFEEKDDTPLLEADISRLIKLSREVGYKKQDNIPLRNLVDFKPISIDKLATEVQPKSPNLDTPDPIDNEEKSQMQEVEDRDNNIKKEEQDLKKDPLLKEDKIENNLAQNQVFTEPAEGSTLDKNIEIQEKIEIDKREEEELLQENLMSQSSNNDQIEAARKEGIEIGKKMALSEMEIDHRKNIDAINLVVNNIKSKETIDKSELLNSINDVIISLASERAGLEIDKTPKVLKDKIVAFVEEIEHASKKVTLNLHPKDAELIEDISIEPKLDENIEIKKNSELFRGDFIIQMGTIEMGNLISRQLYVSKPEMKETTITNPTSDDGLLEEGVKNVKEHEDAPNDQLKSQKIPEKNDK